MLRIKLVKTGKKNSPTWRVVVVEKTKTGKGRVSDYIGNYNPHTKPKRFLLDIEKYEKWIKNGAQPTDTIVRLKGNFLDKNKEYQKVVKAKVYKKKKTEEVKKGVKKEIKEEIKNEEPVKGTVEANGGSPEEKIVEEKSEKEIKEEVKEEKEAKKASPSQT